MKQKKEKMITSFKDFKRKVDNKMRYFGDTDLEKKVIRVNKSKKKNKKGDIIDTIVHEEMHAKHPKMHEYTVRRKTKAKLKKLTVKHKTRLYSKYK